MTLSAVQSRGSRSFAFKCRPKNHSETDDGRSRIPDKEAQIVVLPSLCPGFTENDGEQ
jgi:hypothetical protein